MEQNDLELGFSDTAEDEVTAGLLEAMREADDALAPQLGAPRGESIQRGVLDRRRNGPATGISGPKDDGRTEVEEGSALPVYLPIEQDLCWRCGNPGHIRLNCTGARTLPFCSRCGLKGTLSKECAPTPQDKKERHPGQNRIPRPATDVTARIPVNTQHVPTVDVNTRSADTANSLKMFFLCELLYNMVRQCQVCKKVDYSNQDVSFHKTLHICDDDVVASSVNLSLLSERYSYLLLLKFSGKPEVVEYPIGAEIISSSSGTVTASETKEEILKLSLIEENSPKIRKKRKRSYVGDMTSSDFSTPEERRKLWEMIKTTVGKEEKFIIYKLLFED
ncbi:hypothetical protein JTB14_021963 [Gonioctena quinquepunctata]|nr:hypothetical protein JTB14_021963 [Gonioctena quinquepunctata]